MKKTPEYCYWDRCKTFEEKGDINCSICDANRNNPIILEKKEEKT